MFKESFLKSKIGILVVIFICCVLWGSAYPCVKICYELFHVAANDSGTQILLAGSRFFISGILTIIMGSVLEKKLLVPYRGCGKPILVLALLQTIIQYVLFYLGMAYTTGVKSSIIEATNVFVSIIITVFILRSEKYSHKIGIGCIIGFVGVVLINLSDSAALSGFSLRGEGAIILSSASYGISSVMTKIFAQKHNPVLLSGYQFLFGSSVMIVIGLCLGGQLHPEGGKAVLLLVYMGFLSAAAYSLWALLLKYNPVSKIAVYGFLNPLFGTIMSIILLEESRSVPLTTLILPLILVCSGIYLVNKKD